MSEYNEYTPHELNLLAEVYKQQKESALEESVSIAWIGEYYRRIEKLPPMKECLDELMGRTKVVNEMTDDAMLEMAMMLNARYGGDLVEGDET